jgi:hypothetical protein
LELASPDLFVPALSGWKNRSVWIAGYKAVNIYHFDFYSQAFAKISRGHPRDLVDVNGMLQARLIARDRLWDLFQEAIPLLERYPALEQNALMQSMREFCHADED